ncbi:MAG: protein phosphatase 2C domain-containing protein, partial [Oscillospiraceae bacterium]
MKIAGTTDMGFKRSDNQDRYMAGELSNGCAFAFVCDGMGGANGGSVASEKLAKYLEECLFMQNNNISMDEEKTVMDAIDEANRAIFVQAENDAELKGMGTTISGLTIKNGLCKVYNAGDSRVYVL